MSRQILKLNVMRKIIVLLALLLGVFAFANAKEVNNNRLTNNWETTRFRHMQPLKFVERGVEFFVFPNGEFDFNTHPRYRRSRRNNVHFNISYGTPRSYHSSYYGSYNSGRSVRIEHDHLGRVRRIGNVFINYDRFGRIKRAGSIYMNYRHNLLSNIGGLHIYYNRHHRIIRTTGYIKHNLGCHYCGGSNCTINHYDNHNSYDNHHNNHSDDHYDDWGNNEDLYYYKNKKSKKNKR